MPSVRSDTDRRERRERFVQRGRYAVELEVEVVDPFDDPSEPCLDAETAQVVDKVAQRVEAEDLAWLKRHGRVFYALHAA